MKVEHNTLIRMPATDYHAHPAISKSGLDLVARSPAHYKYAPPKKETRPMLIGSATHAAILEPEVYAQTYIAVRDAEDRKCKTWNEAAKRHFGRTEFMLTGPEVERIETMAGAVRGTAEFIDLLDDEGQAEVAIFTKDPATGVEVRIRIDWLTKGLRAMDLKTTEDLRNDKWARSVYDYRYHVQQAFYTDVFKWAFGEKLQWAFGVIESSVPHVSKLWSLPDDLVAYGRMLYRRDLDTYARCLDSGKWPGPEEDITTLITPSWLMHRMEDDMGSLQVYTGEAA